MRSEENTALTSSATQTKVVDCFLFIQQQTWSFVQKDGQSFVTFIIIPSLKYANLRSTLIDPILLFVVAFDKNFFKYAPVSVHFIFRLGKLFHK